MVRAVVGIVVVIGGRGKVLVVLPDQKIVALSMGETPQEQSNTYLTRIVDSVLIALVTTEME